MIVKNIDKKSYFDTITGKNVVVECENVYHDF